MNRGLEVDAALLDLLKYLADSGYDFITPTPETHWRVLVRKAGTSVRTLRDLFGWNVPVPRTLLPAPLFDRLAGSGLLREVAGLYASEVRVSSVGTRLFLHSTFPTESRDAVFFGPDSYRFVKFIEHELAGARAIRRLVDIGSGAGVGGVAAAALLPDAQVTLTDINPLALYYAGLNARGAGLEVELIEGDGIDCLAEPFDLAISNPPFMFDSGERAYRHGGTLHGAELSLAWGLAAARRLAPGGRMLLYTGSAIVGGEDRLHRILREQLPAVGCSLRYSELDPDIFGEQLDQPGYEDVERIAAVGAVIERPQEP